MFQSLDKNLIIVLIKMPFGDAPLAQLVLGASRLPPEYPSGQDTGT
jgi:hypothetical protein